MMNKEYVKSLIDCVSGIEVKSEAEQIAKYELIEYIEDLQQKIDKAKRKIESMFNNGDENTIIDDLLELDKILGGKE